MTKNVGTTFNGGWLTGAEVQSIIIMAERMAASWQTLLAEELRALRLVLRAGS